MTALGVAVTSEAAFIWADTALFERGRPSGAQNRKLIVNERGRLAAAGAGNLGVILQADELAAEAHSIHRAAELLPATLLRAVLRAGVPAVSYVVAGYSTRWRRPLALVFLPPDYAAKTMRQFASPELDELATVDISSVADVRGLAQQQIARLEATYNCRIAGEVHTAVVTADQVAARVVLRLGGQPPPSDVERRRVAAPSSAGRRHGGLSDQTLIFL